MKSRQNMTVRLSLNFPNHKKMRQLTDKMQTKTDFSYSSALPVRRINLLLIEQKGKFLWRNPLSNLSLCCSPPFSAFLVTFSIVSLSNGTIFSLTTEVRHLLHFRSVEFVLFSAKKKSRIIKGIIGFEEIPIDAIGIKSDISNA